ncbi:hypothetical protein MJ561_04910 [Klebsiella pneumoniae]|nr:hypothetical protein MJ561_04910 [Klebsiella pneumoniae]
MTKEIIPPLPLGEEVVLPFNKFPGVDPLLGPEMRSTGKVMGVSRTFARKSVRQSAAGQQLDHEETGYVRCSPSAKAIKSAWLTRRQKLRRRVWLRAGCDSRYSDCAG